MYLNYEKKIQVGVDQKVAVEHLDWSMKVLRTVGSANRGIATAWVLGPTLRSEHNSVNYRNSLRTKKCVLVMCFVRDRFNF